jgi:hypothetical protein
MGPNGILVDAPAFRPGCPLIDPGAQQSNLLRTQRLTLSRHLDIGDQTGHQLNQRTIGATPGLDGWAVSLASLQRIRSQVETKSTALFLRSVTTHTGLLEDGLDISREVYRTLAGRR